MMALNFRKSLRLGPLRLSLNRHGIGASIGVEGARVGIDASGREYVAGGRYGLYFREHGSRVGTVGPPPSRQPCKKVYELVGWFKANRV